MEVHQGKMWCTHCGIAVRFTNNSFATVHVQSADHTTRKGERLLVGLHPGPSAVRLSPPTPQPFQPPPTKENVPQKSTFEQQKQASMQTMMAGLNNSAKITEDSFSAFMQAGLPPHAWDHPSIWDLVLKHQFCPNNSE